MTSARPLSKCPSDYHFWTDDSPEHELETTEEDSPRGFIGARNIGMNGNPGTGKYRGEAAPKDAPYRTLIGWAYARWSDYNSLSRITA